MFSIFIVICVFVTRHFYFIYFIVLFPRFELASLYFSLAKSIVVYLLFLSLFSHSIYNFSPAITGLFYLLQLLSCLLVKFTASIALDAVLWSHLWNLRRISGPPSVGCARMTVQTVSSWCQGFLGSGGCLLLLLFLLLKKFLVPSLIVLVLLRTGSWVFLSSLHWSPRPKGDLVSISCLSTSSNKGRRIY